MFVSARRAAFVTRRLDDGRQTAMPEWRTAKVEDLQAAAAFWHRNRRNAPVGKATGFRGRAPALSSNCEWLAPGRWATNDTTV